MSSAHRKDICGLCKSRDLVLVLDLGEMPVSNGFLRKEQLGTPEARFPLGVQLCTSCLSHQLTHAVPSDFMFDGQYAYVTAASKPLVEHFTNMAGELITTHDVREDELVVEIGSNDGTLLTAIKDRVRVLGIDPAAQVAQHAIEQGVPTTVGYFSKKLAEEIVAEHGRAKLVVANNVMAHIDDLPDVFAGVKDLLAEHGSFVFEVHWVGNLLTEGGFDQIYHEHFYYHSLHAIRALLASVGMILKDVRLVPIHGESIRVTAGLTGAPSEEVAALLAREKEMGLTDPETYLSFGKRVAENRHELVELLKQLKSEGKRIAGYGAPAKGNTLLNYFGIGPDLLEFLTDTTPGKQGLYTPGTHIPIVHPETLEQEQVDYLLLLSWNYADAILKKEQSLRDTGVKFIIPVPKVRIV